MKELSIEEKAKRYDEIREKAQKWYDANTNEGYRGIFEDIFPELKESEDERIMGAFRDFAENYLFWGKSGLTKEKALAWLEKQGEQKSLDDIVKEVTKDKDAAISFLKSTGIINENGELADEYKIEQDEQKSQKEVVDNLHNYLYGEQKPKWIPTDEQHVENLLAIIEGHGYPGEVAWLKSLKDRVQPQKHERSEEDETALDVALWCCKQAASIAKDENEMGNAWYAERWLKSRILQNTWKPSDEQMDALHDAAVYVDKSMFPYPKGILMKLYKQLKKLRK